MARTAKKRKKLKYSVFIACEGRNTEPNYFNAIKEVMYRNGHSFIDFVDVYPDRREVTNPKTHASGLVEIAREKLAEGFNEAWVVFDKDHHRDLEEAFRNANILAENHSIRGRRSVQIAYSSIAFEQWVLLHYEKNEHAFDRSTEVIKYIREKKYYSRYSKKAKTDLFTELNRENKTETAIENAAWLRHRLHAENKFNSAKIIPLNPYTDVDRLVSLLLGIERKNILWIQIGQSIMTDGWQFEIKSVSRQKEFISLDISIIPDQHMVVNPGNVERRFAVRNKKRRFIQLYISETAEAGPGQEARFTLEFLKPTDSAVFYFYFMHGNQKLIAEI